MQIFCQWVIRDNRKWCHSYFCPFIPRPMNAGYKRNCTIYWMLIQSIDRVLENLCPAMHHAATQQMLSLSCQKTSPLFHKANCFRMLGSKVRQVSPMSMGPLSPLICIEESSFLRNSVVQNITMMDKAFLNSTDVGFGRNIAQKEDNSVSRISIQ